MAKTRKNNAKRKHRVGDAAFLPRRHLPAAPAGRKSAGFFYWHGRLEKLPVELQQIFLPLLPPDWERLRQGEIVKTQVFVPQIGALTLQLKDGEVWATFVDALQWAYQLLQHLRCYVLALRYRTVVRNEHGGTWILLPRQIVFPPDFRPTLFCVVCQTSLLERSPPFWKQNDNLHRKTDEAPCPLITNLWLDAAKPRAQRAPSALPAEAGAVGWV
jgi:hypothetical protein